jgi:hypothetical protein
VCGGGGGGGVDCGVDDSLFQLFVFLYFWHT